MTAKKKTFHWRGWTTFVVTISFIVDTLSGIILYIAPPGRIANWTNWKIWGLTKEQWGAVHTIFGYVLLLIVVAHLYFNWRLFVSFLWNKARKVLNLKWELALSIVVCLVIFLGSVWNISPFSTIMGIGEHFKQGWEQSEARVPLAHAELLTLNDFAESIKVPVEQITEILKSRGYTVADIHQTVGEIAKANNISPNKLYENIKAGGVNPTSPETVEGSGMGRKTLMVICQEQGLSLERVLSRLKEEGLEAKPDDRLKDLATQLGKKPTEMLHILREE